MKKKSIKTIQIYLKHSEKYQFSSVKMISPRINVTKNDHHCFHCRHFVLPYCDRVNAFVCFITNKNGNKQQQQQQSPVNKSVSSPIPKIFNHELETMLDNLSQLVIYAQSGYVFVCERLFFSFLSLSPSVLDIICVFT